MDEEGANKLAHMRERVKEFSFFTLLLEAILIGLSFAIATVWSNVIVVSSEYWLSEWAAPLQKLIGALFVSLLAIFTAVLSIFYLWCYPRAECIMRNTTSRIPVESVKERARSVPVPIPRQSTINRGVQLQMMNPYRNQPPPATRR